MRHPLMIAALLALFALPSSPPAPPPSLPSSPLAQAQPGAPVPVSELVARASYWTTRFERSLSGLLFRERYRQQRGAGNRRLEANVFMLHPPGFGGFVVYRDVYRVDGRDIGDHTARLQTLLTDGSASAMAQARRLTDESARHNLAGVRRNINVPTMPYEYLTPAHVRGISAREAGRDTIAGLHVVIVDFEETARPTVVRSAGRADVPATGRFWIHPESGAVPRAMVQFTVERDEGRLDVELTLHRTLTLWVPKEMTEVWQGQGRRLDGRAQYDRFERLTVSTNEIIK